jgi:hypothetical protein
MAKKAIINQASIFDSVVVLHHEVKRFLTPAGWGWGIFRTKLLANGEASTQRVYALPGTGSKKICYNLLNACY